VDHPLGVLHDAAELRTLFFTRHTAFQIDDPRPYVDGNLGALLSACKALENIMPEALIRLGLRRRQLSVGISASGTPAVLVRLKISAVSTSLKLLRLGIYWTERSRHGLQAKERL
jgi:hypothetical protein